MLYSFFASAKSRIKGTLEIYHAFINVQAENTSESSTTADGSRQSVDNASINGLAASTVSSGIIFY